MMIFHPGSPLEAIIDEAQRFARSDATVLVTGETGTGKEVFARLIHDASPRSTHAFVAVNCGAIPESLIEAELFGHVKGAFTGAHAARKGRVAMAQGGTLFLDEIGELSLPMQVKLLRLLQQRTYEPVGSSETQKADFRLVAATNRDLATEVAAGRFRSDLYYRIFVCPLHIPPLRDRGIDDLMALFFSFWKKLGNSRVVDNGVFTCMSAYPWPGNVRELENFVERLSVCARGDIIQTSDVPESYRHTLPLRTRAEPEPEPDLNELSWLDALPGSVETTPPAHIVAALSPAHIVAAPQPLAPQPLAPQPLAPQPPAPQPTMAITTMSGGAAVVDSAVRLPIDLSVHLDAIERGYIEAALRATSGNKQASADLLGLQRTTLVAKCKKHGLGDTGKTVESASGPAGLHVEFAEEQRPVLMLRGASFKVAVIREEVIELIPAAGAMVSLSDTSPVAGSCVVDGETLRLFGALHGRDDGMVLIALAIPLERSQLVSLQRSLVKRRLRIARTG
jgi:sigma-54 specific flagellar transcriptional regulator A